jgi:hypothetical protein
MICRDCEHVERIVRFGAEFYECVLGKRGVSAEVHTDGSPSWCPAQLGSVVSQPSPKVLSAISSSFSEADVGKMLSFSSKTPKWFWRHQSRFINWLVRKLPRPIDSVYFTISNLIPLKIHDIFEEILYVCSKNNGVYEIKEVVNTLSVTIDMGRVRYCDECDRALRKIGSIPVPDASFYLLHTYNYYMCDDCKLFYRGVSSESDEELDIYSCDVL